MTTEPTEQDKATDLAASLKADMATLMRLRDLSVNRATDLRNGEGPFMAATEALEEEWQQRPLSADVRFLVDVTLTTGGPAAGVVFECERNHHGELYYHNARAWHQDWFTGKAYSSLDDDTAECLWQLWGLEFVAGQ